jgi:hypothetical protein
VDAGGRDVEFPLAIDEDFEAGTVVLNAVLVPFPGCDREAILRPVRQFHSIGKEAQIGADRDEAAIGRRFLHHQFGLRG